MPSSLTDRAPEVAMKTAGGAAARSASAGSPTAQLQNPQLGAHPRGPVLPLEVGNLVAGGPVWGSCLPWRQGLGRAPLVRPQC